MVRKHFPIIGEKYNSYTVISEQTELKDGKVCFHVQCKCGIIEFKMAKNLKSGRCKSCKSCASKVTAKHFPPPLNYKSVGDLGSTYFSCLKNGAIRRGILFDIEQEYAWNLLVKQDFKCALSKLKINLSKNTKNSSPDYSSFTASLDRIDSTKGYIIGNVQWVHKDINRMKWRFDEEYFKYLCNLVSKN